MPRTPSHLRSAESAPSRQAPNGARDRIIALGLLLVAYGAVYFCLISRLHYSTDSYLQIYNMAAYWHLQLGRYLNFGMTLLLESLGMNTVLDQRLFLCLWIVSLAIATAIIVEAFARLSPDGVPLGQRLLYCAATALAFINVFNLELILFPEMASFMAVASLALGASVYCFLKEGLPWKIASVLFLLVAIGGYQSLVGSFVAFSLAGVLCKLHRDGNTRAALLSCAACFAIALFVSIFDVVLVKYLIHIGLFGDAGRGATFALSHIAANLVEIFRYQGRLYLSADGLLPGPWVLLLALCIVVFMAKAIRPMPTRDKVIVILAVAASYVFAFAAHIVEARIILTHRSNIAFWALLAALSCFVLFTLHWQSTTRRSKAGNASATFFAGALAVMLAVNALVIQDIATDIYQSNCEDREIARLIDDKLDQYEEENGVAVDKIAAARDAEPAMSYPEVRYHGNQLGVRILQVDYSYYCLINYESGRMLEKIEMPDEVFDRYFAGKDWDALDLDEQLVVIDDTAYIAMY